MEGGKVCKCSHHKFVPFLVLLLGLAFLFERLGWMSMTTVGWVWPVLVVVAGFMKLMEGKCKCC